MKGIKLYSSIFMNTKNLVQPQLLKTQKIAPSVIIENFSILCKLNNMEQVFFRSILIANC